MKSPLAIPLAVALLSAWSTTPIAHAFSSSLFSVPRSSSSSSSSSSSPSCLHDQQRTTTTVLHGGVGVAETYSWNEEQFELEVKIKVPPRTSAKDVKFKCSSESIDLRLLNTNGNDDEDGGEKVLLNGERRTRGKISVDGTFWSIEGNPDTEREITIAIEKHFVPASRDAGGMATFDAVTDFDWGGLYPNDEEEVSHRKYDEAEELDVREYAAKLGVDIDNIDMSKVNKTMFGSGLGDSAEGTVSGLEDLAEDGGGSNSDAPGSRFNITQATLDQLTKSGLAKEVVRQGDGSEYEMGADGMQDELFSMLGKDVSEDELREAGIVAGGSVGGGGAPTAWQTVPVEEAPGYQKTYDAANALSGGASSDGGIIESEIIEREMVKGSSSAQESVSPVSDAIDVEETTLPVDIAAPVNLGDSEGEGDEDDNDALPNDGGGKDPIDMLTVARLKEILRAQGLKVGGKKQDLRDRLRAHVSTLLQEEGQ